MAPTSQLPPGLEGPLSEIESSNQCMAVRFRPSLPSQLDSSEEAALATTGSSEGGSLRAIVVRRCRRRSSAKCVWENFTEGEQTVGTSVRRQQPTVEVCSHDGRFEQA